MSTIEITPEDWQSIQFAAPTIQDVHNFGKWKYKAYIPVEVYNKYRPDDIRVVHSNPNHKNNTIIVPFGDSDYEQYYDRLGEYSEMNHFDEKRRLKYQKRHSKIMMNVDGKSKKAYKIPFTPAFFSWYILW